MADTQQRQHTRLIANDIGRDLVVRVGILALELGIALGASDKESAGLINGEQTLEVHVVGSTNLRH